MDTSETPDSQKVTQEAVQEAPQTALQENAEQVENVEQVNPGQASQAPTQEKQLDTVSLALQNTNPKSDASYLSKLPEVTQEKIKGNVQALFNNFLNDRNYLIQFGTTATAQCNRVVDKILEMQGRVQVVEVSDIINSANRELQNYQAKYAKSSVKLDQKAKKLFALFQAGKFKVKEFRDNLRNTNERFDRIGVELAHKEVDVQRQIAAEQQLVDSSVASIEGIIETIASFEVALVEGQARAKVLQTQLEKLEPSSLEYLKANDSLSAITEVIQTIEQQKTDMVERLFIAWSAIPQTRNIIKVSSDIGTRLALLRANTLPVMKQVVAQIAGLQQAMQAGRATQAIINANNAAVQLMAKTAEANVGKIAELSQQPSLTRESIDAVVSSLIKQNEELIAAIETGRNKRAESENAIAVAATQIAKSASERDKQIVEKIIDGAKTVL